MFIKINKKLSEIYNRNRKIIVITISLLIIFLSLFPRSIEILNQNPIFGFDQGREYLAAKNIVVNHKQILIGTEIGAGVAGISGIFQGPVYYYLLTIPFILFNGNPTGGVVLMLAFGLLSIAFGFYFGRKLFGNLDGLFLSLLISISPIFISQSRFIWSPNPPTFFILLSFYFVYLFPEKKALYVVLAALFAAVIYNFELAVSVPLSLAIALYSIFIFRKQIKFYLYLLLGFVLGFSPMIFFEIRHGFMGIRGLINYLTNNNHSFSLFSSNLILDHTKSFIFNFKDTFPVNNFNFALIFFTILIFLSAYLLNREKNKNFKYFYIFLIFLIPVNFFVFSFLKNTVWSYYLTDLSLIYVLLFAYVLFRIHSYDFYKLKVLAISLIIFLTFMGVGSAVKTSLYDYADYGGTAKLRGKIDAIDYIYKDAKGKPFGLLVFSPPVYTYPYDYLIWWYGQKKYNYSPYKDKKGVVYLLIEKDSEKPWSYEGWLETVIKNGTIIKTINLPSGFIVQERRFD